MVHAVPHGSLSRCSKGSNPSRLNILPITRVFVEGNPLGNIQDKEPFLNIHPYGICFSMENPEVIAATAAALGVLVPMPCVPMICTPWILTSRTRVGGHFMGLNKRAKNICVWAGHLEISLPKAVKTYLN
jgi:hypothetical protein